MSDRDARVLAAEAILAREGLPARVSATGHAGDVAAVTVPAAHLARLAELAPELKALGFRYVAIDLEATI